MATDTSDVQVQPGSATVPETAIVLDPIRDGSDRSVAIRESMKDSHASDMTHKPADQTVEREPNDTTLVLKPMSCTSKSVEKPRISITRDLSSQTDLFYQVIEIYQKSTNGRHLPPDFDIKKAHNWDEVHQAARLAETKCKKDGTRSILGKIGRGIQRSAPAVEPWLWLIPDGDYTSVLCGGLKIAFGVAGRIHAQRDQIFETFQQIPETIRLAEDRLEEWPDDVTLQDAAIELYLAVLKSIEAMIIWLVDTSTRKKIWQLLMNPKTEKPNDIGLDVIEKEVKRLRGRATTLQSKAIVRTDAKVEKTGHVVDIIKISTQNIERIMIEELRPVMNETRNLVRETRWKMDAYAKATRSNIPTIGVGIRKPGTNAGPLFRIAIGGKHERFIIYGAGDLEELTDFMIKVIRPVSERYPGLWRRMYSPFALSLDPTLILLSNGVEVITQAINERYANSQYRQNFGVDPTTGDIMMNLHWLPMLEGRKGEDALHGSPASRIPKSERQVPIKSKL